MRLVFSLCSFGTLFLQLPSPEQCAVSSTGRPAHAAVSMPVSGSAAECARAGSSNFTERASRANPPRWRGVGLWIGKGSAKRDSNPLLL